MPAVELEATVSVMVEQATAMTTEAADGPIVTVFRNRLRDEPEGYDETAVDMFLKASSMPGFMEFKQYTADDGERVAIVQFDSLDHQKAWRNHPDHLLAQQRGREEWYAEYRIQVCRVLSERKFGQ
jgi:heme-degrading monooxygenase HmoA